MRMVRFSLCLAIVLSAQFAVLSDAHAFFRDKFVSIGTGEMGGIYFPLGGGICRLVNKNHAEHKIKCNVESTGGAIHNLNLLHSNSVHFGLTQSDWLYHAYNGKSIFENGGARNNIRVVMYLHKEYFTTLVREASNVKKFDDAVGKRVNSGAPGTGINATTREVFRLRGWDDKDFSMVSRLDMGEQVQALCDQKIDVAYFIVGHPAGAVREAAALCGVKILPVPSDLIKSISAESPFYQDYKIPGGLYAGNPKDVETFGLRTALITTVDVEEEIVYGVISSVLNNIDGLRTVHPVFKEWKVEDCYDGDSLVPYHAGAVRYYKEQGLIR